MESRRKITDDEQDPPEITWTLNDVKEEGGISLWDPRDVTP